MSNFATWRWSSSTSSTALVSSSAWRSAPRVATPIPRTLMMTAYGDLDVSRLTEKPPGRRPVDTRTVALERLDDVVDAVGRALAQQAKVYWICPMVEESETADLAAVEERHRELG